MTAGPARIRIDYFNGIEETEALHLGAFPDGAGELFRVGRPSICVGGVARRDVVRLELYEDRYVSIAPCELAPQLNSGALYGHTHCRHS